VPVDENELPFSQLTVKWHLMLLSKSLNCSLYNMVYDGFNLF